MWLFKKKSDINSYINNLKLKGKTIGFVPTMGALHEGHLSLIRIARKNNDIVVASIFVNPTQFNDPADLEKYPRPISRDIHLLLQEHCDVLFYPDVREMYPKEVAVDTRFDFGYLGQCLEARHRPGHFEGVAHIVKSLLMTVEPDTLYLGQKDYQQYLIVKKMLQILNWNIELICCPIVREKDGLAMSSRNVRLSAKDRKDALLLSKVLFEVKEKAGQFTPDELRKMAVKKLSANSNIKLDYFDIVNAETLKPVESWKEHKGIIACVAATVGNVRLIDNVIIQ